MSGFKFEDYRQPWETGPHWELKREFMEKYNDMFEEDRLLCLAQAYSNIVLMNCSYPEPVMRQIGLLAEPLQMRKRFQEKKESSNADTPQNVQQREKIKLLYQNSGRPFKQVKFCSSEDQPKAVSQPEPEVSDQKQQAHGIQSSIISAQPNTHSQTEQALTGNNSKERIKNAPISVNIKSQPQNIENTLDNKSSHILRTLGLEFIQNFVQKIRTFQVRLVSPLISIVSASQSLKIDKMIDFQFDLEPNCPSHAPIYCCKFSIKDCLISAEKASNKKMAKSKAAEAAVDILIKLSNCIMPDQSVNKCDVVAVEKKHVLANDPVKSKNCSNILEQVINLETGLNINSSESSLDKAFQEDMDVLHKLAKFCANKNSDLAVLRSAAAKLGMENCIFLQRTVHTDPAAVNEKYEWKCFIKSTLVSSAKCKSHKEGEIAVVNGAFEKLRNLSDYEIINGELKERPKNHLAEILPPLNPKSEIEDKSKEIKNTEQVPFILNKSLFSSSMRDGFVLVDKLANRILLKNFKNMLNESANFCRKSLDYNIEEFHETFPPQIKVQVLIGNITVGIGLGASKEEAKTNACNNAVEMLRKKYYTIQLKNNYTENCAVFRDQAFSNDSGSNDALNESNIGCKMLKSMGWTGGGLGASGIAEPIEISTQHGFGIGLGFKQGDNYNIFKKRINSMLMDFSRSESFNDLIFSKEFSKEERKEIHQTAARYGLHTVSRGLAQERFLIVRRKYSAKEVLAYLEKVGGSSTKFELIDASNDALNPFKVSNAF